MNELEAFLRECAETKPVTFDAGWEFHRQLAAVAGNTAMTKIAHVLYGMVQEYQQQFYDVHFGPEQDLRDHFELLNVIRMHDPPWPPRPWKPTSSASNSFLDAVLRDRKSMERRHEPDQCTTRASRHPHVRAGSRQVPVWPGAPGRRGGRPMDASSRLRRGVDRRVRQRHRPAPGFRAGKEPPFRWAHRHRDRHHAGELALPALQRADRRRPHLGAEAPPT